MYAAAPAIVTTSSASNYQEWHKAIVQRAEWLLSNRTPLLSFWQDVAENFYPQRADFTITRTIGDELGIGLSSSYPLLVARDLQNDIGEMSRPTGQDWFAVSTNRDDRQVDNAAKRWLEMATRVERRAMYDPAARFTRASKETDGDYAVFGNGVISSEVNKQQNTLLYRNWHLRDMAWAEMVSGEVGFRVRQWEPTYRDIYNYFPRDKIHPEIVLKVTQNSGKDAYGTARLLHIIIPMSEYDGPQNDQRRQWMELWVDVGRQWIIIETPRLTSYYTIPRWQTITGWRYGTQYACSPAVTCALPDARVLQAMAYTMLRAGEKAVDPPMIAVEEALRSDIAIYPGAITYVDADYDEKMGEVLRAMSVDKSGLQYGNQFIADIRGMIKSAFYIDKLTLPPIGPDMTATEVRARVQEYVRQAISLFAPIEQDYSHPICSNTFDLLMSQGAFGRPTDIPDSLSGTEIKFTFDSPLIEAKKQIVSQTFVQGKSLIDIGAAMDPALAGITNAEEALRDALDGIGYPADWLKDEDQMDEERQSQQSAQALRATLATAQGAGQAAQSVGAGAQALGQAAQGLEQ